MTKVTTEHRLEADKWLDRLDMSTGLAVMLDNQAEAIDAVRAALPQIEAVVAAVHEKLSTCTTGRLVYAGAGTSARVAVQDGAELLPTFEWPDTRTAFVIAGGQQALLHSIENAEDDVAAGEKAVADLGLGADDCLIALAASGKTPFTIAAVGAARRSECLTVGISNNIDTPLIAAADYPICLATGAEAIAGSTRLKAGTAQKICLNLISTQLMVLLGKVQNGLMAEMKPRNTKLRARHTEICALLGDAKNS